MQRFDNSNHYFAQKAVVLIIVQIYLLVLSMLAFSMLESHLLQQRLNGYTARSQQLLIESENALNKIEKMLRSKKTFQCITEQHLANSFINQDSKTWRIKKHCELIQRGIHFSYVLEKLKNDDCLYFYLQVKNHHSTIRASVVRYRISLQATIPSFARNEFLQSVVAVASNEKKICHQKQRVIELGRQSWRRAT